MSDTMRRGLRLGVGLALLILLLAWGNTFAALRLRLNNLYFIPQETSDSIIIVGIDNESLAAYGRSPVQWDRSLYADLVTWLNQAGARVVAFDVLFAEPTPQDATFAEAIRAARQGETRTRVVMPLVGAQRADAETAGRLFFTNVLPPVPELAQAVETVAFVNTFGDIDATVRRQASLVETPDGLFYAFDIVVLLTYSGVPPAAYEQLIVLDGKNLRITPQLTPNRVLPVDEHGLWQQNFFGKSPQSFEVVSIKSVLDGDVAPALFQDKIVLVGLINATGLTDRFQVPLGLNGDLMAGIEVHANAIETLLQEIPLHPQSRFSQTVMLVALTMGSSLGYARLRWYWMLAAAAAGMALFLLVAFVVFDTQQVVIDLLYGVLALALPALLTLGIDITQEAARRRRAEFLLKSVVAVSTQQMNLALMSPIIAQDIQTVVAARRGSLWLWDDEQNALVLTHVFPPGDRPIDPDSPLFNAIIQEAAEPILQDGEIALPVRWQNRLLAAFFIQPENPHPAALRQLQTLVAQVAPSLENARLFTQVQRQKELVQAILDGSPNPILVFDQGLHLLTTNPGVEHSFHLDTRGYIGRGVFDLLSDAGLEETTWQTLAAGFQQRSAFLQQINIGKGVFYCYALPLLDDKWVVILNNVTSLAQLSDLKTQMIRMASHDLKNPLARIMGFGELMGEGAEMPTQQRDFLKHIMRAADEMLTIIQDILNLEHLQATRAQREPLDLPELVREVAARHKPDLTQKEQTLELDFAANLPPFSGDYRMLSQAVSNLLGNAVKYTPDGGKVAVRVYLPQADTLRLEVRDTGYGIPEDAQEKLFTQFYRVRTAETAHIKGTGLGLSLVKSVVEEHQGKIWVESVQGRGSTFYVELPLGANT